MTNKTLTLAVAALTCLAFGATTPALAEITLKFHHDLPEDSAQHVAAVKFKEAVFVLHVFQKKSKSGITTPKPDMDIIRERLKVAEKLSQEMRNE